jgi:hypothetical protein
MIIIKAKLLHIFTSADYTNKETQQVTLGKVKLQLLVQSILRNNEVRNELLDITVPKEK